MIRFGHLGLQTNNEKAFFAVICKWFHYFLEVQLYVFRNIWLAKRS